MTGLDVLVPEHSGRVRQVRGDGLHALVNGQERPYVGADERVVVDVGDPGVRDDGAGALVHRGMERQSGAEVEELGDALARCPGDGTLEEGAIVPGHAAQSRAGL